MKNYVVIANPFVVYRHSYADVMNMDNVRYIDSPKDVLHGIKLLLYNTLWGKSYISKGIRKMIKIIFPLLKLEIPDRSMWFHYIAEENYFKDNSSIKDAVFLISDYWLGVSTIPQSLRRKYPQARFVTHLCDLIESYLGNKDVKAIKETFDLILSFDRRDCVKYGFIYHPLVFSEYRGTLDNTMKYYDIYFLGHVKNRFTDIIKCFEKCWELGLTTDFWLVGVPQAKQVYKDKIHYIDFMSYDENLQHVLHSKCELEIMQQGGTGFTQRVCEVISMGKLLITNNTSITETPFYNNSYILQISSEEDITIDFAKRIKEMSQDTYVDYHYKDQISPISLLKLIEYKLGK